MGSRMCVCVRFPVFFRVPHGVEHGVPHGRQRVLRGVNCVPLGLRTIFFASALHAGTQGGVRVCGVCGGGGGGQSFAHRVACCAQRGAVLCERGAARCPCIRISAVFGCRVFFLCAQPLFGRVAQRVVLGLLVVLDDLHQVDGRAARHLVVIVNVVALGGRRHVLLKEGTRLGRQTAQKESALGGRRHGAALGHKEQANNARTEHLLRRHPIEKVVAGAAQCGLCRARQRRKQWIRVRRRIRLAAGLARKGCQQKSQVSLRGRRGQRGKLLARDSYVSSGLLSNRQQPRRRRFSFACQQLDQLHPQLGRIACRDGRHADAGCRRLVLRIDHARAGSWAALALALFALALALALFDLILAFAPLVAHAPARRARLVVATAIFIFRSLFLSVVRARQRPGHIGNERGTEYGQRRACPRARCVCGRLGFKHARDLGARGDGCVDCLGHLFGGKKRLDDLAPVRARPARQDVLDVAPTLRSCRLHDGAQAHEELGARPSHRAVGRRRVQSKGGRGREHGARAHAHRKLHALGAAVAHVLKVLHVIRVHKGKVKAKAVPRHDKVRVDADNQVAPGLVALALCRIALDVNGVRVCRRRPLHGADTLHNAHERAVGAAHPKVAANVLGRVAADNVRKGVVVRVHFAVKGHGDERRDRNEGRGLPRERWP